MNNQFGKYLTKLRTERGLSERQLSKLTDISYSHISNIENGRRSPNKEIINKLSECLKLNEKEKLKMFDLAAIDHTRINNIPDDIAEYIENNNSLINVIRLASNLNYTDEEWKTLINHLNQKPYF